MNFIRVLNSTLLWSRGLNKSSFVFLLVACSLQIFKWLNMIVRVQFFGGQYTRVTYDKLESVSRPAFILLATAAPLTNLAMIIIEAASSQSSKLNIEISISLNFLVQSTSQAICFIVLGSFLVRKLYVYFRRNYDCQRRSFLKALTLVTISLIFINLRYSVEYLAI